ncbi:MAG: hypothetical protein AAF560_10615 [Acidobacteriota bacterium]
MRFATLLALGLTLLMPTRLTADVEIACVKAASNTSDQVVSTSHTIESSSNTTSVDSMSRLPTKLDLAGSRLSLPYFEIDMMNTEGATTLFALRNVTDAPVNVQVVYAGFDGDLLEPPTGLVLGPKETVTTNLRFEGPFPVDPDGFSRGTVVFVAEGNARVIVGDYFQVIPDQDFASGDRLLNVDENDANYDLCKLTESRFLNGGAFTGGSTFTIVSQSPGGIGVEAEATVLADVYDQAGNLHEVCQIFTDQLVMRFPIEQLTDQDFGTVELTFVNDNGQVITEFDATNRFSVGVRGVCKAFF